MNNSSPARPNFRYTRGNRPLSGGDGEKLSKSKQMEQGMKLSKVRIGEKFVFDDRGGVWEKTAEGKAKCFFGSRDMWNKDIDIPAEGYCYIPDFNPRHKNCKDEGHTENDSTFSNEAKTIHGTRVRIVDEDAECMVKEIESASDGQIAILGSSKTLRFTPPGKIKPIEYCVLECRCDMDDGTFYVMVTSEGSSDEKGRND